MVRDFLAENQSSQFTLSWRSLRLLIGWRSASCGRQVRVVPARVLPINLTTVWPKDPVYWVGGSFNTPITTHRTVISKCNWLMEWFSTNFRHFCSYSSKKTLEFLHTTVSLVTQVDLPVLKRTFDTLIVKSICRRVRHGDT